MDISEETIAPGGKPITRRFVSNIDAEEFLEYPIYPKSLDTYEVLFHYAAATTGKIALIYLDGALVTTLTLLPTGGLQSFAFIPFTLELKTAKMSILKLKFPASDVSEI